MKLIIDRCIKLSCVLLATGILLACNALPVPDESYYQIPRLQAPASTQQAWFDYPIAVDTFLADGVYNEQGILYATSATASLRAYHYQLWSDPPVKLLQRRLIKQLRASGASDLVLDRLPTSRRQLRVVGLIESFERVRDENGNWSARVGLEIRVGFGVSEAPLLVKNYQAHIPAEAETLQSSVRAFTVAIDQIFAEFVTDLSALKR